MVMLSGGKKKKYLNYMDISDTKSFIKQHIDIFGKEFYLNSHKKYGLILKDQKPTNESISDFKLSIENCNRCNLGNTRTKFVFGVGDPNADLLLVGEGPGEKEDLQGEPFVGRAGKLLDKILKAIGYSREKKVFITNIVKCRPPDNRDPLPSEVEECFPFLEKQIDLINPKIIVALGKVAGKTLLKKDILLKEMRNETYYLNCIPLRVTYHPAALLRNPSLKNESWKDFQYIRDFLAS
jgi:uracil-DNA glycosylase family 4